MVELLLQREADVALASEPWMQMRRVTLGCQTRTISQRVFY